MADTRLDPVFAAVLEDPPALERLLAASPELGSARMSFDLLIEALPHWLYAGDTPLHLASAGVRASAVRLLLRHGALGAH